MSLPGFHDPERAGSLYPPDTARAIAEGFAAGLPPARSDERRILLLLVDPQVDFIHPDGALAVPGAVDDTRRTVEWICRHAADLTALAVSLDSHIPIQIFYPTWWSDGDGGYPAPFTPIRAREVDEGRWRPRFEREWSIDYVHRLEEEARKELMIWPYHTMVGTPGHAVAPPLYEAIAYHAAARQTQPTVLIKGLIPKSEFYSVLEPEVAVPEHPQGTLNRGFLDRMLGYDLVYLAGQAKSHCVLETLATIMRYHGESREMVGKIRLLEDCTSSVGHPTIDFEGLAQETLSRYADRGLRRVRSTDPIG